MAVEYSMPPFARQQSFRPGSYPTLPRAWRNPGGREQGGRTKSREDGGANDFRNSSITRSVPAFFTCLVPASSRSSTEMQLPRDLIRLNRCGDPKILGPHLAHAAAP